MVNRKSVQNFARNIKGVVGVRQSCQSFRQNTWFLVNNQALFKALYEILINKHYADFN